MSNGKDMVQAPKELHALYTNVRHWEELIDFYDISSGMKGPYIVTSMFKCTLEQDELDEDHMGLYTCGQIMNDPIYGQIWYNGCLSNDLQLKLSHN